MLIDQGDADNFYPQELQPEKFVAAAKANQIAVEFTLQPGYDHSYFFIATFIEKHIAFHQQFLQAEK